MSFFSSLFGGKPDDLGTFPWEGLPAIYAHIHEHLDEQGILQPEGFDLPDEARAPKGGIPAWAPGAQDGVITHHVAKVTNEALASEIAGAMDTFARKGKGMEKLYGLLRDNPALTFLDLLIAQLAEKETPLNPYLFPFLRKLVQEGADREAVKTGIALLGVAGDRESEEFILTLGKHDEFTLFTAVALANLHEDPEAAWWDLAKKVQGWGRIHLVERLAETQNPEIQEWMLREGFQNEIMDQYLVYIAATTGNLKAALQREEMDEALLASVRDILVGLLLPGGPAADIDVYEDAAEVLTYYVHLLANRPPDENDKVVLELIRQYVEDEDKNWQAREQNGWTEENREQLLRRVEGLLSKYSN